MSMHTIQLDVSGDIIDRVIAFLEIFPKNKIKFKAKDSQSTIDKSHSNLLSTKDDSLKILQSHSMSKSWDNKEDEAWDEL